tara:strand:+ start:6225 stop:6545 length:321 start_codon:yes stop_codon:yes gene_type:complete
MINFDDFTKLDLRIGKIIEADFHPDADKLLLLKVDIGDKQIQLVAGIKEFYTPSELPGKKVVVLTNLEPRKIRGCESEGMVLVAKDEDSLGLIVPEKDIAVASKIS